MKLVFDTNVYISGTFWEGAARILIDAARVDKIKVFISLPILQEVNDTLTGKKFRLSEAEAFRILRDIQTYTKLVLPAKSLKVVKADPDDDKIFECAYKAEADIVTGDKHLIEIGSFEKIKVYTVQELLKKIFS